MAYKISDDCIMCGACEGECPVGAISEGDGKYQIDPDKCISCGACEGVCPVGAPAEACFFNMRISVRSCIRRYRSPARRWSLRAGR